MIVRPICKRCVVSALVILGWSFGLDRALFAQPGQADVEEGVQVLTRGPVHEAFAETVTFDPEQGIVVPTRRRPPPSKNCRPTRNRGGQRHVDSRLLGMGR